MKKIVVWVLALVMLAMSVSCTAPGGSETTQAAEASSEDRTQASSEAATTAEDTSSASTAGDTAGDGITEALKFNLVPAPRDIQKGSKYVTVSPTVGGDAFDNARKTLREYTERIHDTEITEVEADAAILFQQVEGMNKEAYTLTVGNGRVTVTAGDEVGAQNAVVTIIQLAEAVEGGLKIPECTITDEPDCEYRAVMVDLARAWHEPHYIYEYIDMCRFFKIRYLQLHFTDAQLWTLPSKEFPHLPTPGKSYTEEEIKSFIEYANLRGVSLIPEIEVPGHSSILQAEYPRIFGTGGIVCQSERSLSAVETLFAECCELFEGSEYIHIGGDEATISLWLQCDKCLETYRKQDPHFIGMTDDEKLAVMYAGFITRVADVVFDHGMTPVVWEGFPAEANEYVSKDILVISWENYYQTTPSLLESGFNVVNASWNPMYIVTPQTHWTANEIYEWNIYTWKAIHPDSPYRETPLVIEPTEQVKGGILLAWGDQLSAMQDPDPGIKEEQKLIEERIPFLSYNTWNLDAPHPRYNIFNNNTVAPVMELYQRLCETRTETAE